MRRLMNTGNATTLLLVVSLAFNFGLCLAMALEQQEDPAPRPRRGDGGRHREHLSDKLNLTPEQTEELSASREQLFEELRAVKHQLHEEGDVLAELLTAAELDMDAISAQVDKVAEIRNETQRQMIQHILSVRDLLEPEQLESFKEFVRRIITHSDRRGRHGGKPTKPGERDAGQDSCPGERQTDSEDKTVHNEGNEG